MEVYISEFHLNNYEKNISLFHSSPYKWLRIQWNTKDKTLDFLGRTPVEKRNWFS